MKPFRSAGMLAAATLPSLLACCATTPGACDPNRADFFNNTSCLASGAYRERQRNLESELSAEQSRNRAFRVLLADLQAEQDATRSDLRSRQADLARAEANWRQIKGSLAAESRANPALATRMRQIDDEFARAEAGKRAERDALANKVLLLEQELDAGIYE
jgi:chromosome segregation ATPase